MKTFTKWLEQQAASPSQTAQQAQQTMHGVLQMIQQNNSAGLAKQIPGLMQILSSWQRELQIGANQQPQQPQGQPQQNPPQNQPPHGQNSQPGQMNQAAAQPQANR